jgi:cytidylate kinase
MKTSSELMGEAFDRALNRWRSAKVGDSLQAAPGQRNLHWSIAISRESGAGSGDVARELATRLGWEVFDRALLEKIAGDRGVRAELLQSVDEKRTHWLLECIEAFFGAPTVTSGRYAHDLAEVLLALAAHGNCIFVGRGAAVLLPVETTLRVRIVAALEDRIERVGKKRGLTKPEASRLVATTDQQRTDFVQTYFHKDPNDTHSYDLTVNTSRFSAAACAELIARALEVLQTQERAG